MNLLRKGKTKDVYAIDGGNILLRFKDTVTGGEDGQKDPGGNLVVGEVKGVGSSALRVTARYFEILKAKGLPTHYISADLDKNEMTVRPAQMFGRGLEFVVRYKAWGSFVKRFADYCKQGDVLDSLMEVTLKDDAKNDPPATRDILTALKLLTPSQFDEAAALSQKVCAIVKEDLAAMGLELIDIKVETGLVDGRVALIDEISGGNMRVAKDGKVLDYIELSRLILSGAN